MHKRETRVNLTVHKRGIRSKQKENDKFIVDPLAFAFGSR